ncbi:chaperone protein dnaJ 20, chloroplastic-like isoform X2 [Nymphaea colorata]|uniref:chaperone protein dnaJ 20, chloroplastic-like isoform X2 n=1 Tax=Nymphaea colorata TaxID=210225 RepID=UPI00129EA2BD|nr:chaperone protein dnaJ 20, chloroplastic-like isoform X2 [Nymphaea colorata]
MDAGKETESNLYGVLGLKKDCSATDLRSAYKKLALRRHPDRCSYSGSDKHVEEWKMKFQAVQEAYSVHLAPTQREGKREADKEEEQLELRNQEKSQWMVWRDGGARGSRSWSRLLG